MRVEEVRRQRGAALEQAFVPVDVQRRETRRAGRRMARIGVAVEELDRAFRRGAHDRVVDALADRDRAHRLRAVGDALGHRHQVGRHAEALRGERLAGAAEAADHLVEHEQDAVRVADLAQALQVALRRHQAAGRAGDRLDEAGGDVLGAVEIDEAHQVLGQLDAVRAFAAARRGFPSGACGACARCPGSVGPKLRRLLTMPASDTPPKLTPWYARSRETNMLRPPWPRAW